MIEVNLMAEKYPDEIAPRKGGRAVTKFDRASELHRLASQRYRARKKWDKEHKKD